MDRIVAPPAAQGSEFHRGLSAQQQLPKVLLADFLKHLAHVVGKVRFDALIYQIRRAAGDQRSVLRHKPIPKAEHVVVNEVDRLFRRFLPVRQFLLHDTQRNQIFQISGADVGIFANFAGNSTCGMIRWQWR